MGRAPSAAPPAGEHHGERQRHQDANPPAPGSSPKIGAVTKRPETRTKHQEPDHDVRRDVIDDRHSTSPIRHLREDTNGEIDCHAQHPRSEERQGHEDRDDARHLQRALLNLRRRLHDADSEARPSSRDPLPAASTAPPESGRLAPVREPLPATSHPNRSLPKAEHQRLDDQVPPIHHHKEQHFEGQLEIITGGSIIMPIDRRITATTISITRKGT